MNIGIVRFFSMNKGYGFIKPITGGDDVLLHISSLQEAGILRLNDNDKLRYDLGEKNHILYATNLSKEM